MATIHAYVLERYARSNDALRLKEIPARSPGEGELRVRIHAVAVNPVDIKSRDGEAKMILPMSLPFVPGVDLAGVVEQLGPGVEQFAVGDPVYAYTGMDRMGAFADAVVLPETIVARTPRNLPLADAAALPLPGLCALQALRRTGVMRGHRVLIHGGAGAVGRMAVQIAARIGAEVVTTVSGRDVQRVRSLGATQVIDYTQERFEDKVRDVDVALDTVGGDTAYRSLACLRPGGRLASLHVPPEAKELEASGLRASFAVRALLPLATWRLRRAAQRAGVSLVPVLTRPNGFDLAEISSMIERNMLGSAIDRRYSFDRLPEALDYLGGGKPRGRVLVLRTH